MPSFLLAVAALLAVCAVPALGATTLTDCATFVTTPPAADVAARQADCAALVFAQCLQFGTKPADGCDKAEVFALEAILKIQADGEQAAEELGAQQAAATAAAAVTSRQKWLAAQLQALGVQGFLQEQSHSSAAEHGLLAGSDGARAAKRHHTLHRRLSRGRHAAAHSASKGHSPSAVAAALPQLASSSAATSRAKNPFDLPWTGGLIRFSFWGGGTRIVPADGDISQAVAGTDQEVTLAEAAGRYILRDSAPADQQLAIEAFRQWSELVNADAQAPIIEFRQVAFNNDEGPKLLIINHCRGGWALPGMNTRILRWGHLGNNRPVSLLRLNTAAGGGCSVDTIGEAVHEAGHVLGLWHTQMRHDALTYITNTAHGNLNDWNNGDVRNIAGQATVRDVGLYDYGSIMGYPPDHVRAPLNNIALNSDHEQGGMGQHISITTVDSVGGGINVHDVAAVRQAYGAHDAPPQGPPCACPLANAYTTHLGLPSTSCWTLDAFVALTDPCKHWCQHWNTEALTAHCWFDANPALITSADTYPARNAPWVNAIAHTVAYPARNGACPIPSTVLTADLLSPQQDAVLAAIPVMAPPNANCAAYLRDVGAYKRQADIPTRDGLGRALLTNFVTLGGGTQVPIAGGDPARLLLAANLPLVDAELQAKTNYWTNAKFTASLAPCIAATLDAASGSTAYATALNCLWA